MCVYLDWIFIIYTHSLPAIAHTILFKCTHECNLYSAEQANILNIYEYTYGYEYMYVIYTLGYEHTLYMIYTFCIVFVCK